MLKQMFRTMIVTVIALLFTVPFSAQTTDLFTVTTPQLNARTGPGIEYDVIARLGRGSSYEILDYSVTGNWALVDLGFSQAWVFVRLGEVDSFGTPNIVTTTRTVPTTVDPASLGQGGGFVMPTTIIPTMPTVTETGVDVSVIQTTAEFNSTIGVTSTLRIRIAPSLNARILTAIPYDQRATPVGRNYNGTWIQINYEGVVGWVYFLYVAFPAELDVASLPVTG